jgi:general stress protein 26
MHMVPMLGVWLEGAVCFSTGRQTRKARDLAENDNCAITVPGHNVDLVIEGTAHLVRDAARLQRVADLSTLSIRGGTRSSGRESSTIQPMPP